MAFRVVKLLEFATFDLIPLVGCHGCMYKAADTQITYEYVNGAMVVAVPLLATQAEVNTGTNTDRIVTPDTLEDKTLGTYTGAIITDNAVLKVALQELETAIEAIVTTANGIFDVANNGGTVPTAYVVNITDLLTLVGNLRVNGHVKFGDTLKHIKGDAASTMEINSAGNSMLFRNTPTGFMRGVNGSTGFEASTFPTIDASAVVTMTSTTKGFLPPRMTTTQRDAIASPATGLMIFNTTTGKHQGYDGTVWNDFY